ncbi:hypothetical protein TCDM_11755 [Trypanosoma cruzi Dm28c]|uniref:Uncharacterized protein n=1 Tax=Trypanosoma cruzi Dm28c TaxID=1416333 RepID=V5AJ92_TRYCR|nr:hypothetical protein TCDM_11755 [Trypanosoma cruzi Dm28c]
MSCVPPSLSTFDSLVVRSEFPLVPFCLPFVLPSSSCGSESVLGSASSVDSAAHTDEQQHRASTNRAHSRRHVIIIVSVVVQWCGADLHSEGHGEQQGRREVRQTHTERTPHEERAAATHAPYAAHHAQHTDGGGRSKQERHTRLHRMCIRRERSVVPAPSRRVRTHTGRGAAHTATQRQTNNKRRSDPRTPRGLLVHGKCSQYSSHKQFSLLFLDLFFAARIKSEQRKGRPYKSGEYSVSYGLRQSQTVTVPISNNGALPQWMRRSLPWSAVESAARGVRDEAVAEKPGPSRVPALCFLRFLPAGMLGIFGGDLRERRLLGDGETIVASAWEALANYYNARPKTSGMCRHTVDGQAHSAAGWAGGCQFAAR